MLNGPKFKPVFLEMCLFNNENLRVQTSQGLKYLISTKYLLKQTPPINLLPVFPTPQRA